MAISVPEYLLIKLFSFSRIKRLWNELTVQNFPADAKVQDTQIGALNPPQ
jgi:hypothetical protein